MADKRREFLQAYMNRLVSTDAVLRLLLANQSFLDFIDLSSKWCCLQCSDLVLGKPEVLDALLGLLADGSQTNRSNQTSASN